MTQQTRPVRLAIIGCGAVAELCHLPAAEAVDGVEVVALADPNLERARRFASDYRVPHCAADYKAIAVEFDGAIVAAPSHLHVPFASELLQRGIPVLVEKPMAFSRQEAEVLVRVAETQGVALQVGLMYRFFDNVRVLKQLLQDGSLGRLQSFALESGHVEGWSPVSGYAVDRRQAGGGVFMDIGSHMLDLVRWWFGTPARVTYRDDARGGLEAECELSLVMEGSDGAVPGTVVLSRLRELRNTVRVVGERQTAECDLTQPSAIWCWPTGAGENGAGGVAQVTRGLTRRFLDAYAEQLRAFALAISEPSRAVATGREGLGTVGLIEDCYRNRQPLKAPWDLATSAPAGREATDA